MAFYIPHIVEKIRAEFALIERALAAEGEAALTKVRAALKRIEGHTDTIHAAASELQPAPDTSQEAVALQPKAVGDAGTAGLAAVAGALADQPVAPAKLGED